MPNLFGTLDTDADDVDGVITRKKSVTNGRTAGGNYVGEDMAVGKQMLKNLTAKGDTLVAPRGHPVTETPDALIARAYPHMLPINATKRREAEKDRADAMVMHAVKKFPQTPLRLDGNKKFVTMAIDSALTLGVAVEVPRKYHALLVAREAKVQEKGALKVQEKGALKGPEKGALKVQEKAVVRHSPKRGAELGLSL